MPALFFALSHPDFVAKDFSGEFKKIPKYSVNPEGKFMVNDKVLSPKESLKLVQKMENVFNAGKMDENKSNQYLAGLYSTLSFYAKIYYRDSRHPDFKKNLTSYLSIKGANVALEILQAAGIVKLKDPS